MKIGQVMVENNTNEIEKVPYKDNFFLIEPFTVYNFFRVRMERGSTPKKLEDQMFTNRRAARIAIDGYINSQKVKSNG
jgi:hypothetical protein